MSEKQYPLAIWGDWYKWNNTTYMNIITGIDVAPTAMMDTHENTTAHNLSTYQGHFDARFPQGIPLKDKIFTLDIDVQNIITEPANAAAIGWCRLAVVVVFKVPAGFKDPMYGGTHTELFMEFDYYWAPGTQPHAGGNFRFLKVAQKEPGSGWGATLHLAVTEEIIKQFGQAAYDGGFLTYISFTHEIGNAHTQASFRNVNLTSTDIIVTPAQNNTLAAGAAIAIALIVAAGVAYAVTRKR